MKYHKRIWLRRLLIGRNFKKQKGWVEIVSLFLLTIAVQGNPRFETDPQGVADNKSCCVQAG